MGAILVVSESFPGGGIGSVLSVASALRARGHSVTFLGVPDEKPAIEAEGFGFSPIFEEIWPPGLIQEERDREARGEGWDMRATARRLEARFQALRQGALARAAERVKPDVFLITTNAPVMSLAAAATGARVVQYATMLYSRQDPDVPPLKSHLVPGQSAAFHLRCRLAWRRARLGRWVKSRVLWDEPAALRLLARETGFGEDRLDFSTEFSPQPALPTLVLCPAALELKPRYPAPGLEYVEPAVDPARPGPDFPWDRVDPSKPLVYCALGGLAETFFAGRAKRMIQTFLDAMATRPGWQGVAATGHPVEELRVPPNVVAVRKAPQLAILQRAAAMVTHAGFNSVKECVYFGVPMVALPMFFDHPGYAARVVKHGLGVRGSPDAPAAAVAGMVDRVLSEPAFAARARAMGAVFADTQRRAPGVELVDRAAGGRGPQAMERSA